MHETSARLNIWGAVAILSVFFTLLIMFSQVACRFEKKSHPPKETTPPRSILVYDPVQPLLTETAIGLWNTATGCNVFVQVYNPEQADVFFLATSPGGEISNALNGLTMCVEEGCLVWVHPTRQPIMGTLETIVHELGHVVGLKHAQSGAMANGWDSKARPPRTGKNSDSDRPIVIDRSSVLAVRHSRCER